MISSILFNLFIFSLDTFDEADNCKQRHRHFLPPLNAPARLAEQPIPPLLDAANNVGIENVGAEIALNAMLPIDAENLAQPIAGEANDGNENIGAEITLNAIPPADAMLPIDAENAAQPNAGDANDGVENVVAEVASIEMPQAVQLISSVDMHASNETENAVQPNTSQSSVDMDTLAAEMYVLSLRQVISGEGEDLQVSAPPERSEADRKPEKAEELQYINAPDVVIELLSDDDDEPQNVEKPMVVTVALSSDEWTAIQYIVTDVTRSHSPSGRDQLDLEDFEFSAPLPRPVEAKLQFDSFSG